MSRATRQGWLEVSGTGMFSSWKRYYVVMDGTKMIYYSNSSDQAPFGTDKQGEIDVAETNTDISLSSDSVSFTISNRSGSKKFRAENAQVAKLWCALARDTHALQCLAAVASCVRDEGYRFDLTEIDDQHVIVASFRLSQLAGPMTLAISVQSGCVIITTKGIPNCPNLQYRRELVEAVTLANWGMRVGGFNMDYRDGEIRFQNEIPLRGCDPRHFKALILPLIGINLRTHERYYNGFNDVKEGRKTGAQAIQEIEGPGSTAATVSSAASSNTNSANPTGQNACQVIARQVFDSQHFNYTESPGQIIARKNLASGQEMLVKISFGAVVLVLSTYYRTSEERVRPAIVEALTRANWGMRIGQFIMDPRDGEIMYQSEVALPDLARMGVDTLAHLIIPTMMANFQTHERYLEALGAVRDGSKSAEHAIAEAEGQPVPGPAAAQTDAGTAARLAQLMAQLGGGGENSQQTTTAAQGTSPNRPPPAPAADSDYRDILLDASGFSRISAPLAHGVNRATFASAQVVVKNVTLDPRGRESFIDEIRLQMRIHHPNLVGITGIAHVRVTNGLEAVEDRNNMAIVQQYCPNGSLASWLRGVQERRITYNEFLAVRFMEEAAQGMAMLHAKDIIHQDLKAENVLINADQRALVGDFGLLSHVISVPGGAAPSTTKDMAALMQRQESNTLLYVDPAAIESGITTRAGDVYAFGIILHHVFVTRSLVDMLSLQDEDLRMAATPGRTARYVELLKDKYRAGMRPSLEVPAPHNFLDQLSAPVKAAMCSLIPACLDKTPGNRPQFDDVCVILNRLREYLESIGANRVTEESYATTTATASGSTSRTMGPVEVPPDIPAPTSNSVPAAASASAFQLLPTVEAIKAGLGIDASVRMDEALRQAADILGVADEVAALKTARDKAIRIRDEMGL